MPSSGCIGGAIDVLLETQDVSWSGIDSQLRLFLANGVTLEIPVVARASDAPILVYEGHLDAARIYMLATFR